MFAVGSVADPFYLVISLPRSGRPRFDSEGVIVLLRVAILKASLRCYIVLLLVI